MRIVLEADDRALSVMSLVANYLLCYFGSREIDETGQIDSVALG